MKSGACAIHGMSGIKPPIVACLARSLTSDDADLLQIGLRRRGERGGQRDLEHVVRDRVGLVAALRPVREQQGERALRGRPRPASAGSPKRSWIRSAIVRLTA